jgi:hypothetical protein
MKIDAELSHEQLIGLAMRIAINEYKMVSRDETELISKHEAKKKYGGIFTMWERAGLLVTIPTNNGRTIRYDKCRLDNLWQLYITEGKISDQYMKNRIK